MRAIQISPQEKALIILQRVTKRHLERHWHHLHIGSIDNKRQLEQKKQEAEYRTRRAIERMNNMLKSNIRLDQAKFFNKWKENAKELSLSLQNMSDSNTHMQ